CSVRRFGPARSSAGTSPSARGSRSTWIANAPGRRCSAWQMSSGTIRRCGSESRSRTAADPVRWQQSCSPPCPRRKEAGVEEKEVIEKHTIRREEPVKKVTNVNVGPDGTTNVQTSADEVVEEEHVVEEHEHKQP